MTDVPRNGAGEATSPWPSAWRRPPSRRQRCLTYDRCGVSFAVVDEVRSPRKAAAGDKVAVVSPSFAAPGFAPAVHEQAMVRLTELTGLVPVEYSTTRRLGASAQDRAEDLNAAFGDSTVRAVLATIGGDDQITVIPWLDPDLVRRDPKPFVGYSDNTNILHWLWTHGVAGFHGGSTQVHLGPGPAIDPIHAMSLRAALISGERLEITEPGESEDMGKDWLDPAALVEYGERQSTEPWVWAGPRRVVTGRTWGGCIEVLQWILTAGRLDNDPAVLDGAVLLVETSEELIPAREFGRVMRSLGERGVLGVAAAVILARPPTSNFDVQPTPDERASRRTEQRDVATRHNHQVQPGRGHRGGRAVRPHPTPVDPPVRRNTHHRQRKPTGLGGLFLSYRRRDGIHRPAVRRSVRVPPAPSPSEEHGPRPSRLSSRHRWDWVVRLSVELVAREKTHHTEALLNPRWDPEPSEPPPEDRTLSRHTRILG